MVALLVLASGGCTTHEQGNQHVVRSADDLYSDRFIPHFELDIAPDELAASDASPKKWIHATFRSGDTVLTDVAVRLKGHRSARGWSKKPSIKLRFDKFVPGRTFLGLSELVLNNLAEDPTLVREAIAYRLHRDMGVAAPRTGYATLSVNGVAYGTYLDLEAPDETFLARSYGDGSGELYEGEYGCDLYPDDALRLEQDAGDEDRAPLTALAELAAVRPDDLVAAHGPLDRRRVLAYLAVSAVIGDFDGYRHSHNYRLYRDPSTGSWSLLPWGLDRSFKKHLALLDSGGLIARRCFADASCRADYLAAVDEAAARLDALVASGELARLTTLADAPGVADPRSPMSARALAKARSALTDYLRGRAAEVRAELACLHPGGAPGCAAPPSDAPVCEPLLAAGAAFTLCTTPLTYAEASAACRARGLSLARVDDKPQSKALGALIAARGKDRYWIGLSDRAQEGTFTWQDGAALTDARWAKGQPDDDACGEDCAALRGDGKWSDAHCELRRPFLCR